MNDAPLLHADAISRHFGARSLLGKKPPVQAVTGVSLSLQRGEAVGLVGESGSGKSTIGRLLLGLLEPTRGRVLFDGQDLSLVNGAGRARLRRRMQLVFQDPYASLDPRRRVGAQIADGLAIHGLAADRAARRDATAALLEQVGLHRGQAERFPHEFSGGQRQRIGLARALATRPEFIVADEPVSALDVSVQAQVLHLLSDLRGRLGLGLLFISHDLHVVRSLCDRVMVLYLGRVVEEGSVRAVMEDPRHPYTQALLSASPSMDGAARGRRILLAGDPPSPSDPPSGCVFRTRCPRAIVDCATTVPALHAVGTGHQIACIRS